MLQIVEKNMSNQDPAAVLLNPLRTYINPPLINFYTVYTFKCNHNWEFLISQAGYIILCGL